MMNFFTKKKEVTTDPVKNNHCEIMELDKWDISNFIIKKLVPIVGIKPYPLDELMLMVETVCKFKPKHIFEWGTHIGKSARIFHEIVSHYNISSTIYSFDLPDNVFHEEHPQKNRGKLVKNIKEVLLFQQDGVEGSLNLLKKMEQIEGNILFFLDGDHEFKSVKRELNTIFAQHSNAIFLCHDTFYQSLESGYNIGPFKAIEEFIEKNHHMNAISTNCGLPGMTLIYDGKKVII